MPTIFRAEIEYLPREEGGRKFMPDPSAGSYMPHVVVGPRTQRRPTLAADGVTLTEDYLGVCLLSLSSPLVPGEPTEARFLCMYEPGVDYTPLDEGAEFTIREGALVVGHGVVLSRDPAGELPN